MNGYKFWQWGMSILIAVIFALVGILYKGIFEEITELKASVRAMQQEVSEMKLTVVGIEELKTKFAQIETQIAKLGVLEVAMGSIKESMGMAQAGQRRSEDKLDRLSEHVFRNIPRRLQQDE